VRTTLTLDKDVADRLAREARRSGRSFKEIVNDAIRTGLDAKRARPAATPFRVVAKDLGALRPGVSLDSVVRVLEAVDGADAP
jgi:hypothetical protein